MTPSDGVNNRDPLTIAITGVGGAAGLTAVKALKEATDWKIVGLDAEELSGGFSFSDYAHTIPYASTSNFVSEVLSLAEGEEVAVLIPTVDEELIPLAKAQERFRAIGVAVAVSKPDVLAWCLDKYVLHEVLREGDVDTAQTWMQHEFQGDRFPVVVKPRTGRGGRDVHICATATEAEIFLDQGNDSILQEHLPGAEYTVDVLSDLQGNPLVSVPRLRLQVKGGVSWRGRIEDAPEVARLAADAARCLGIVGPSCIQVKLDRRHRPKVLEVNPRIGGTTSLTIYAGVNIPYLAVRLFLGETIRSEELRYRNATVVRYFGEVFLDGE